MFNGKIENIHIYNRGLSPEEIQLIYEVERVMFVGWIRRLWFWIRLTVVVLLGKARFIGNEHEQD